MQDYMVYISKIPETVLSDGNYTKQILEPGISTNR